VKTKIILLNTAGIFYGLIVINTIILAVSHFLSTGQNIPAMFTAAIGSFFAFILSQLFRIPVLKRRWIIGLLLGFIGSFLTAMFYVNYKSVDNEFEGRATRNGLSISQALSLRTGEYFQLDRSRIRILNAKASTVYEDDVKGNPEPYVVIPVVDTEWQAGDTVRMWAAYNLRGELFGKREEHYIGQLHSSNAIAVPVTKGYYEEIYLNAVTAGNKRGLLTAAHPHIYEFVDREMESAFWRKRVMALWLVINGLWLLLTLPLLGAKHRTPEPIDPEKGQD
jgi:hypothetical protein